MLLLFGIALEESGRPLEAAGRFQRYVDEYPGLMAREAADRREGVSPAATRTVAQNMWAGGPQELEGRRVVVLPFAHAGGAAEEALAAAVTSLASGDVSGRGWEVVAPELTGALLEEADIETTDRADVAIARRIGATVGASHVVRGRFVYAESGQLEWSVIVDDFTRDSTTLAQVTVQLGPNEMVEVERRIGSVLSGVLFRGDPEAHADRVHTNNRFALLDFGRAVLAWSGGDLVSAIEALEGALTIDPAFQEAEDMLDRLQRIEALRNGDRPTQLEEIVRVASLRRALVAARAPSSGAGAGASSVGRTERVFVADLLGLDRLGAGPVIDLTFTLPPGAR